MGRLGPLHRSPRSRAGITLIEVCVVIGIVGLLMAVLIPAIASSRRTALKTQCTSNMRQIGQAMSAYEAAHGELPIFLFHSQLLPYIEQQPLHEEMTAIEGPLSDEQHKRFDPIVIPLFQCPGDAAPERFQTESGHVHAATNYAYNQKWADSFEGYEDRLLRSELMNGESNSPLVSELLRPTPGWERMRTTWWLPPTGGADQPDLFYDQCASLPLDPAAHGYRTLGYRGTPWHSHGLNMKLYMHDVPPNRPSCEGDLNIYPAISMHTGGVNVLYADGHVDFVSENIDRAEWRDMGVLTRRNLD